MSRAIEESRRKEAVAAYLRNEGSIAEVASRFGVGHNTLHRWVVWTRQYGRPVPVGTQYGRKPLLDAVGRAALRSVVAEKPDVSVQEIRDFIHDRFGKLPSEMTIRRYMRSEGLVRCKCPRAAREQTGTKQDSYLPVHRDGGDRSRYPTSLTDAEWKLVSPLFERHGAGRPEKYPRRNVLDAIFYVVRSGCAWRLLPKDLPPWPAVYKNFRRWSAAGLFEKMFDQLRAMWREREGRAAEPTGAIIDSQSVKTTEKGGPEDSMRRSRSRAASATS